MDKNLHYSYKIYSEVPLTRELFIASLAIEKFSFIEPLGQMERKEVKKKDEVQIL